MLQAPKRRNGKIMRKVIATSLVWVDEEDYEKVLGHAWTYSPKKGYVCVSQKHNGKVKTLYLHHLILPKKQGYDVDHVDGNSLNNTRKNLRYATRQQNCFNARKNRKATSIYKGVYFHKGYNKYYSRIRIEGQKVHLGSYSDEKDAALAYDEMALKHRGTFARTNFLGSNPTHQIPIEKTLKYHRKALEEC